MCDRGRDGWMVSPTPWTQVWTSSGRRWRTAKTGVLQSMGSQRVGHDWATEQQQIICHLVMLVSELCKRSNLLHIIYVTFTQLYVSKNHLCCWMWWLLPHVHCLRYFMSWLDQNLFLFFSVLSISKFSVKILSNIKQTQYEQHSPSEMLYMTLRDRSGVIFFVNAFLFMATASLPKSM